MLLQISAGQIPDPSGPLQSLWSTSREWGPIARKHILIQSYWIFSGGNEIFYFYSIYEEGSIWNGVLKLQARNQNWSIIKRIPHLWTFYAIKKAPVIYHFLLLRWLHFSTLDITTLRLLFIIFQSDTCPIKIVGYPWQRHGTSWLPSISSISSKKKSPGGKWWKCESITGKTILRESFLASSVFQNS